MNKQEEAYTFKDDLIDQEVPLPAKSNKIKYTIAIITSVIMLSAIAILLFGHFKLNWFKIETYNIKANIYRTKHKLCCSLD